MPHAIVTAVASLVLDDVIEVGRNGDVPVLHFRRQERGDAVVIAPAGGRIDGRAMVGGLAVIDWGRGALVRAGDLHVDVQWRAARARRVATATTECAVCFGAILLDESIIACSCDSPSHPECAALLLSCPDCAAILLRYRDVQTLVRTDGTLAVAPRDFQVVIILPELWPFDREAALVPIVLAPADFAAPNSDGVSLCRDLRGVRPGRLAELLYDTLRLRDRRLDHCVDGAAAEWVRVHLRDQAADPRPLYLASAG